MKLSSEIIAKITQEVIQRLDQLENLVEVEISAKHVHLSQDDIDVLFSKGYQLTFARELSQPGQFLAKERISLVGTKGTIENVAILGPARDETQVELSYTDARLLGVSTVVRNSGDITGTPGITLMANNNTIQKDTGLIIAARHIHVNSNDAQRFNVVDNEVVSVEILSQRALMFHNVLIRVSDKFQTRMHIDFDEANACGIERETVYARIVKS